MTSDDIDYEVMKYAMENDVELGLRVAAMRFIRRHDYLFQAVRADQIASEAELEAGHEMIHLEFRGAYMKYHGARVAAQLAYVSPGPAVADPPILASRQVEIRPRLQPRKESNMSSKSKRNLTLAMRRERRRAANRRARQARKRNRRR